MPKATSARTPVGLAVEHRPAEIARRDPALGRRAERQFGNAQRLCLLLRRQDIVIVEGTGRRRHRPAIAAGPIASAGQRIQRRNRALDRGRVGVLPDAGPGMIGEPRPASEQRVERVDVLDAQPGQLRDARRRVRRGSLGEQFERGSRRYHPAVACADLLRATQLATPLRRVAGVARHGRARRIETNESLRRAIRPQRVGAQEASGRTIDQQRSIGPCVDEIRIEAAGRDEVTDRPHRERAIGTRANAQPEIGLLPRAVRLGIDHHDLGAAPPRIGDPRCLGEPGPRRIVAPQDNRIGIVVVGKAGAAAEGQRVRIVLVPAADLDGIDQVRAAEAADEALDPLETVDHGRAARRGDAERHRLGAALRADRTEPGGDLGQGLVP
ncbi:hypothetical protein AB7M47_004224 [Bradyrhizobium elkanii]